MAHKHTKASPRWVQTITGLGLGVALVTVPACGKETMQTHPCSGTIRNSVAAPFQVNKRAEAGELEKHQHVLDRNRAALKLLKTDRRWKIPNQRPFLAKTIRDVQATIKKEELALKQKKSNPSCWH